MSDSRSDLALAAALQLAKPLVELLLKEGVSYPQFASALKNTFVEATEKILEEDSARVTDSSLSTLSGVHRKDVRAWRTAGKTLPPSPSLNAVMMVYTRWANDPAYGDSRGRPKVLNRVGEVDSFEALALSVSNDVHPRTLLQELMRLGVVQPANSRDGEDKLKLCVNAFVPKEGYGEMLRLLASNVGDHLAAAVHNVEGHGNPLLEQSLFADQLCPESAEKLGTLARQIWSAAFHQVVTEATQLSRKDSGKPDANQRVRLGMYFYKGADD